MSTTDLDRTQHQSIEKDIAKVEDPEANPCPLSAQPTNPSRNFDGVVIESDAGTEVYTFSSIIQKGGRFCLFLLVIGALVLGRSSVPDNEVACVKDKIQAFLQSANSYVTDPANEIDRKVLQIICSLFADATFIGTFGCWILYGKSARLPVTLAIFYTVRMILLMIWYSPFPDGYSWTNPGLPSLMIGYDTHNGFFFSKYVGIMIICAKEWNKLGRKTIRNATLVATAYVIIVSLVCRAHYYIDIFTAVFFADWCFDRVDWFKHRIDDAWMSSMVKIKNLYQAKKEEEDHVELTEQRAV